MFFLTPPPSPSLCDDVICERSLVTPGVAVGVLLGSDLTPKVIPDLVVPLVIGWMSPSLSIVTSANRAIAY